MRENVIKVKLFDRELTLKTQESPEKIEKIVNIVNEYLENIQKQRFLRDRIAINLLALLNITIEYDELKEKMENINGHINYLTNLIDNILKEDTCGVRD